MKGWLNVERYSDYFIDSTTGDTSDCACDEDDDFDFFIDEEEREEERLAFGLTPKHGIYANAYKKGLDNYTMKRLRKKGYTYRQIAGKLGCSPSTVRNRLKKLGEK